jgi:hypothetical protein
MIDIEDDSSVLFNDGGSSEHSNEQESPYADDPEFKNQVLDQ